jgi:hypothetical protein
LTKPCGKVLSLVYVNKKASKGRNKVISITDTPKLIDVIPSVGRNHHYNRMTSVIEYLTFIAKLAVKHISNPQLNREIKKMRNIPC